MKWIVLRGGSILNLEKISRIIRTDATVKYFCDDFDVAIVEKFERVSEAVEQMAYLRNLLTEED